MNERLNDALAALAEKLGVGVDQIWPILLRQAKFEAISNSAWSALGLASVVVGVYCARRGFGELRDNGDPSGWAFAAVPLIVLGALTFFVCVGDAAQGFFNPEYFALSKILRMVR